MTDSSQFIAQLQSQWSSVHDLDRAHAINSIPRMGVRLQDLAEILDCSRSLLSHLLQAVQATFENIVANSPPAPDMIAAEIVEDLQAALDEFVPVADDFRRSQSDNLTVQRISSPLLTGNHRIRGALLY